VKKPLDRVFVKPGEGLKVRRPVQEGGALMSPEGEMVKLNSYWNRRLAAGDVVLAEPKTTLETVGERRPKTAAKAAAKEE
jgi:hypothetical protein